MTERNYLMKEEETKVRNWDFEIDCRELTNTYYIDCNMYDKKDIFIIHTRIKKEYKSHLDAVLEFPQNLFLCSDNYKLNRIRVPFISGREYKKYKNNPYVFLEIKIEVMYNSSNPMVVDLIKNAFIYKSIESGLYLTNAFGKDKFYLIQPKKEPYMYINGSKFKVYFLKNKKEKSFINWDTKEVAVYWKDYKICPNCGCVIHNSRNRCIGCKREYQNIWYTDIQRSYIHFPYEVSELNYDTIIKREYIDVFKNFFEKEIGNLYLANGNKRFTINRIKVSYLSDFGDGALVKIRFFVNIHQQTLNRLDDSQFRIKYDNGINNANLINLNHSNR